MFSCKSLNLVADGGGAKILKDINVVLPTHALSAVIGPSGCGKTTLVKSFLRLNDATGECRFAGERITHSKQLAGRCGFVPQFSIAHDSLSVAESLRYGYDLNVKEGHLSCEDHIRAVLHKVGLTERSDALVRELSGGQLRRLGLAMEFVNDPQCLICDEVTSGLDPLSEDQILELLRKFVADEQKTLICIIHNLAKLPLFDHIVVLYEGYLVFSGEYATLQQWFGFQDPLRLYEVLATRTAEDWHRLWLEQGKPVEYEETAEPVMRRITTPGVFSQFMTLLRRRFRLLERDGSYIMLLLALMFGFPCIVVVFALNGLPQLQGISLEPYGDFIQELSENIRYRVEATENASLVTGLIMFQVVLLTLMGANNGAREIANERRIFEKEKLNGLNSWAYAFSKLLFIGLIALLQGIWMTVFVKVICMFPGPWIPQLITLSMCCIAMSWICLGFSALLASAEKASLISIYLVGFQLPLSGVVLALPELLAWCFRPFINAYWSWAGYFSSMRDFNIYDAYRMTKNEWLPDTWFAIGVLLLHAFIGAGLVIYGCCQRRSVG